MKQATAGQITVSQEKSSFDEMTPSNNCDDTKTNVF